MDVHAFLCVVLFVLFNFAYKRAQRTVHACTRMCCLLIASGYMCINSRDVFLELAPLLPSVVERVC